MPIYECPKCGRQVELPTGTYYCKVCGPSAVMIKREASPKGDYVTVKNVHGTFVIGEYATTSVSGLIDYLRLYSVPDEIIEEYLPKIKTMAHGEVLKIPKHHSNPQTFEVERARKLAIWRKRGVLEPVRWLDVATAFQEHYRKVRDALVRAVGGYENIKRIKEYPAEPFEAYYKIAITLTKPITAEFKLLDTDVLEFNSQQLPLFIDEKAYTPYRLRLYRYFVPETEKLQKEIEERKYVKTTIQDFYVQVDNPAWWSRAEERFVPRPGIFGFLIYK